MNAGGTANVRGHVAAALTAVGVAAAVAVPSQAASRLDAVATPSSAAAPTDAFDRAFPTAGEPPTLHYKARYEDRRGTHDLEVWRQGDRRLRRRTDEAIDLHAARAGRDDLEIDVVDHRRRIATRVSRGALYRVGHGVEWFALAHGLARPHSAFSVTPWTGPAPAAGGDCRWQRLVQGARISAVCWNARLHLPERIVDVATNRMVWTLVESDTVPIAPAVFSLQAQGYVRVDADRDIEAD